MAALTRTQFVMAHTLRILGAQFSKLGGYFERNSVIRLNIRGIKQITNFEKPDGTLVVAGSYVPSSRDGQIIKLENHQHCNTCHLCNLNLDVKHTDVLILSQYLRSDGCMLPRRITGLCKRQQKRVTYMVAMAQKAGLMSNINPTSSYKDPRKRFAWKKWNSFWDETTIKC